VLYSRVNSEGTVARGLDREAKREAGEGDGDNLDLLGSA